MNTTVLNLFSSTDCSSDISPYEWAPQDQDAIQDGSHCIESLPATAFSVIVTKLADGCGVTFYSDKWCTYNQAVAGVSGCTHLRNYARIRSLSIDGCDGGFQSPSNTTITTTSAASSTTATSSSPTVAGSTSGTGEASSSSPTSSSPSPSPSTAEVTEGLSRNGKIGIGVGISLGVVLLASMGVFLWIMVRRRRRAAAARDRTVAELPDGTGPAELVGEDKRHELAVREIHEMPTEGKYR